MYFRLFLSDVGTEPKERYYSPAQEYSQSFRNTLTACVIHESQKNDQSLGKLKTAVVKPYIFP